MEGGYRCDDLHYVYKCVSGESQTVSNIDSFQ